MYSVCIKIQGNWDQNERRKEIYGKKDLQKWKKNLK